MLARALQFCERGFFKERMKYAYDSVLGNISDYREREYIAEKELVPGIWRFDQSVPNLICDVYIVGSSLLYRTLYQIRVRPAQKKCTSCETALTLTSACFYVVSKTGSSDVIGKMEVSFKVYVDEGVGAVGKQ